MALDHLLPTPVNKSGRWVDADLIMIGTKCFRQGVAVSGRNVAANSSGEVVILKNGGCATIGAGWSRVDAMMD